jgi:putative transposase
VYVWADGVHFRVRLEQARLCCLVIVGVGADGTKELVAVADGERESTDSWAEVLRDLRWRGMRAPVVAVGDGALGLWAALRDVFPATRQQRDWVHKAANVLGCLPAAVQAGARTALVEIRDAPDRDHAVRAIKVFARDYGTKWPKAVAKITDDAEELLAFFDFPLPLICERYCASTEGLLVVAGSSLLAGRGGPSWGQGGAARGPHGRRP